MTTDLEKQFFEAFDIKPMLKGYSECNQDFYGYPSVGGGVKYFETLEELEQKGYYLPLYIDKDDITEDDLEYPQITDTHYLNLMCVYMEEKGKLFLRVDNIKDLKEYVLNEFLQNIHWIDKKEIRELFIN